MKVEDLVRAQALRAVSSHITHMQVGVGKKMVDLIYLLYCNRSQ